MATNSGEILRKCNRYDDEMVDSWFIILSWIDLVEARFARSFCHSTVSEIMGTAWLPCKIVIHKSQAFEIGGGRESRVKQCFGTAPHDKPSFVKRNIQKPLRLTKNL